MGVADRVEGGPLVSGRSRSAVFVATVIWCFGTFAVFAYSEAPGLIFTNFIPLFVAEGRIGNNHLVPGHAYGTHELAIKKDVSSDEWCAHEIGQYVWSNGVPTAFEIDYNPGTAIARLTIGGTTSVWHRVTSTPTGALSIAFFARSVRANSRIRLHNITVNGQAVSVDITASVTSQPCVAAFLDSTFSATALHVHGYATMTFPAGVGRPNHDQLQFLAYIGWVSNAPPSEDADGDGLPDSWEREYFGSPENCDPHDDPDGDGASNKEEYLADTHPNDFNSSLRIAISTSIAITNSLARFGSGVPVVIPVVQWPAASNRTYSVWRATTLKYGRSGFTALAENLPGTPPYNMFQDVTATGPGPYYYRVTAHIAP